MARERKKVEAALKTKGFRTKEGDHHYFIFYSREDKKTIIKTKTSHSPKTKTLGDPLISAMAKQCFLTKDEFLDLVDCPMTQEVYEQKMREKEII